ncbi:MAG: carbon monoxide dehydrogenase subunit G [Caldimonas sp.]
MELNGERLIPAPIDATWAALNDPATLKACIAGCESLEKTADDAYTAVVAMKVGPVSARFRGNLKMTNVVPLTGYTIAFDGQGGVAGFGKGSADVSLVPEGNAATRLAYAARATVGGKMAQIGSRLVDATAAKITEDFFRTFEAHLTAPTPAGIAMPGAAEPTVPRPRERHPAGTLGWALAALVALATLYFVLR